MRATARANTNIALIKYWGKRDERLRLPRNGSLSLTLEGLGAETTVEFGACERDRLEIDGRERTGRELERVSALLDLVREQAGLRLGARVISTSTVPLGAGLASSAAGFAALAAAAAAAAGLELSPRELSVLARRGSGSAARSIFGGLVIWHRGSRTDGSDSYAEQLCTPQAWPLAMAIAIIDAGEKAVGSSAGMERACRAPAYLHWEATAESDLLEARRAVAARDFGRLGLLAEASATKMHMTAAAADPPLVYWRAETARLVSRFASWRAEGCEAYFTVDAGPNVAALCRAEQLEEVARRLRAEPGVLRVLCCRAGGGVEILERPAAAGRPAS
ncbi:MAG: diphosphomevalonate decarboxylase [Planctomycetota bacterium]|nr:MAG: diphosphomevalonate decarboxylase [Planctomycetota bacterium]